MTLDSLIDKQDNFEIVRAQITAILVNEVANQKALAEAAAKDPALWDFGVYEERSNPWEVLYDLGQEALTGEIPLVNVWYETGTFPASSGDTVERQMHEGVFNLDVYAAGVSTNDRAGTGYTPGDQAAAFDMQRVVRLVRNIIMSAENTYLQLRGTVWGRWPQSITVFQPQLSDRVAIPIIAARIPLRVKFNEFSPQATPETLETLVATVSRAEDGKVILNAEYDYTT